MATRQAAIRRELEAQAAHVRAELAELALSTRPSGIGQRPIACGDRISRDRLEVLPTATLCVADRQGLEHGGADGPRAMSGTSLGGHRHG